MLLPPVAGEATAPSIWDLKEKKMETERGEEIIHPLWGIRFRHDDTILSGQKARETFPRKASKKFMTRWVLHFEVLIPSDQSLSSSAP